MRYYWIEDFIFQKYIQLIWKRGIHNWDDYFNKHHPPAYHKVMRPKYLVHCLTHYPFLCILHHYLRVCIIILPVV